MALTSLKTQLLQPMFTTEEHASLILSILYRHEDGIKLSDEEISLIKENKYRHVPVAGLGEPVANKRGDMLYYESTAVIPVLGTMFKRGDWLTEMCGMVSTQRMIKLVNEASENPEVSQIVLEIDSPGGMVAGTHELWTAITEAKKKKPVIAFVQDAYSAAYYIASACSSIYLSSPSAGVGSIGVATQHINMAGFYAKQGIEITDVASEGKRTVSQVKKLDEKAMAVLQELVDSHYSVFRQAVADGRNVTPEYVHENWGKGRIFIGDTAIELGMVEGYKSLEEIVKGDKKMTEKKTLTSALRADIEQEENNPTRIAEAASDATMNNLKEMAGIKTEANDNTKVENFTIDANYVKNLEQSQKNLKNLFGNMALANEMKNNGLLTPHGFATIFGADTSDTEKTLAAIQNFCSASNNDPVRAALNLIQTMGVKPATMSETVGQPIVIERPLGSPQRENKEPSKTAETVVAGIKIDV